MRHQERRLERPLERLRTTRRFVVCGILVFAGGIGAPAEATPPGRYLYEVSCSARVERFDAVTQRKTSSFDLTKRTGKTRLIPNVAGALELCLSNQAVFDPRESVFSTVVPTQAQPREDGTLDYRVLTFSVPAIALVRQASAGEHLEHPPRLELPSGAASAGVVAPSKEPGKEPDKTAEDLSTFAPDHRQLANRIVESSGSRALLHLLTDGLLGPLDIGVADRATKTLVRLQHLPTTTVENIHLSPGGTHVLVEEVVSSSSSTPVKTGKLSLYDAKTGLVIKKMSEPRTIKLYFRGMSPTGKVLYDLLEAYRFVDLRTTFPAEPVARQVRGDFPPPTIFFSDK